MENKMDYLDPTVAQSGGGDGDGDGDIDFIGQGSYSCVFRPAIKCNNTIDPSNPNDQYFVSKISKKDKYMENEFHISSIIQQIPHYYHYFSPILENCEADLYKLSSATSTSVEFEKCNLFKKHGTTIEAYSGAAAAAESSGAPPVEYIYNRIRYVGNRDLYSYLEESGGGEWSDAFTYLSHSISLLREKGIVHYDFKGNNVMVHDKHHTPIIIDFGLSIDINALIGDGSAGADLEARLKRAFYVYSTDYEVWCPEIVFICYFTQERARELAEPIATEDIDFVCDDFMNKNGIFGEQYFRMDDQERDNYRAAMRAFFSEFSGKAAIEAIVEIVRAYYSTWDMYSLVVCFEGVVTLSDDYKKFISADPRQRL